MSRRMLSGKGYHHGGVAPSYTGPGDIISGAVFWGGLRAYSAAYAGGAAIDIVDSSGANSKTINTLTNGNLDNATLASWITAHGTAYITKLYDQSGNAQHLTQTTTPLANNCLTIAAVTQGSASYAINGPSANGVGGLVGPGSVTISQPSTYNVVFVRTVNTGQFSGPVLSNGVGILGNNTANSAAVWGGTTVAAFTLADSTPHTVSALLNGSSSKYLVGAGTLTGTSTGTTSPTGAVAVGRFSTNAELTGHTWEAGIWSGDKSASLASLHSNQSSYYGV